MSLVRKREHVVLLVGDVAIFGISLWLTLFVRYWEIPDPQLFMLHVVPFSLLFVAWLGVFFLAGLYGKHTRLFRSKLPTTIFYTQLVNVVLAALFFFFAPGFGLAPKTILVLYLITSSVLIYLWRVPLFSHLPTLLRGRKLKGVLIASGPDAKLLAQEVASDPRFPFTFAHIVDTSTAASYEVIQQSLRLSAEDGIAFLVVDFSDK